MHKFKDYRFAKFLAALLITLFVFLFWFHYYTINNTKNVTAIKLHTDKVITLFDKCLDIMFDAENAQNNFLITNNKSYLVTFKTKKNKLLQKINKIKKTASFSFAEKSKADSLDLLFNNKIRVWDSEIDYYLSNDMEKLYQSKENSQFMSDKVEDLLVSYEGLENTMMKNVEEMADKKTRESFTVLAGGAVLIGLIVLTLFISLFYEIKKRQKIESELFVSNEWHSKTLSSMGDGVLTTDDKGNIISLNKVAEQLTGWTIEEAKSKPIDEVFKIINEKTKLPAENPIKIALKKNEIVFLNEVTLLIKKDKRVITIDDSAAPVVDDFGNVKGAVLIFRDISSQEFIRKKLLENERFLKDIMNNNSSLLVVKDVNSNFLFVNSEYEKVFNCKTEEIISHPYASFHSPELLLKFEEEDKKVINEKIVLQTEDNIKHFDGSLHFYHTVKFPYYDGDGKVIGICSVSTDITESKKNIEMKEKLAMQSVLTKSEAKYFELTENMPNMLFSLSHSLEVLNWNKACERFNSLKSKDIIGRKLSDVLPHLKNSVFISYCREVLDSEISKNFLHKIDYTGKTFYYFVNIYRTQKGITVLMSDVTEQKRSEEETIGLVKNLQNRNKELRQFAYIVSHNLRAPIAKIQGLISLFSTDKNEAELNQNLVEFLREEAVSLDNVVIDLNTIISTRDSDSAGIINIPLMLKVQLVEQVLLNEIVESSAVIKTDFSEIDNINSVESYVYSILLNLISNAIKYRASDRRCTIEISTEKKEKHNCLIVKDNGIGINLEKNGEKIFGLYKRFHNDHEIDGKGIGLYLVKNQIESLNGYIELESEIDVGTSFKIYFPKI